MQSVKLDSIPQNVFVCLGILEMLRLHVIYVSIEMIALECIVFCHINDIMEDHNCKNA